MFSITLRSFANAQDDNSGLFQWSYPVPLSLPGGQPVLRWMMDNIFIRTDPAGNIKPDKEKSAERIDGYLMR
jgi:hypothetical protein